MRKIVEKYGIALTAQILLILPLAVFAQSSYDLFRPSNPATKKSTAAPERKAAPKPTVARKPAPKATTPRATAKNIPVRSNSARANSKVKPVVAQNSVNKPAPTVKPAINRQPENYVITVANKSVTTNVDDLYEQALDDGNYARDARNYIAAKEAYQHAQGLKPRDSRAIYGLGNIYSDQQRWEDAEKSYRQALALEPNSPEANIALSFVLTQPTSEGNPSQRYTEAENLARRAIKLDQSNAIAYDQLGATLELNGKINDETTQNAYRKAIQLDQHFALAYAHLGRLLRRKGLTNESNAAYKDAIRLSTDVPTMILVADVMQSQQRYAESEQLLRSALRDDSKNPTALFLLGRALITRGSYDEAERLLKKSLDVSPGNFVAYTLLGSLYSRRGNFVEAEKTLMLALKVATPSEKKRLSQDFEAVGDSLVRIGKNKDAARVYRQAITLDAGKTGLLGKLNRAGKG